MAPAACVSGALQWENSRSCDRCHGPTRHKKIRSVVASDVIIGSTLFSSCDSCNIALIREKSLSSLVGGDIYRRISEIMAQFRRDDLASSNTHCRNLPRRHVDNVGVRDVRY